MPKENTFGIFNVMKRALVLIMFLSGVSKGDVQEISMPSASTFGPSIQVNFSNKQVTYSFGFEYSYWTFPFGVDLGVEYESKKLRIYSEAQFGTIGGISVGPFVEVSKVSKFNKGIQSTLWAVFYHYNEYGILANIRGRWSKYPFVFSTGSIFKGIKCYSDCAVIRSE